MLRNKKSMLIISIAASLFLWAFVVVVDNPVETKTIKNVPIALLNLDNLAKKGLVMTNEDEFRLDVKIEGKKSEISRIDKDDIIAEADLYGYGVGEHTVSVSVNVPANATHVGAVNPRITVNIEELISQYEEIEIEVVGRLPAETEVGTVEAQPREVTVKGAKSIIQTLDRVVVRIPADEVTTNERTMTLNALAIDKDGNEIKRISLSAQTIKITARLYSIKEVPLEVPVTGSVDPAYTLSKLTVPDKVVIKGAEETLEGITSLKAAPVDINGIKVVTKIPVHVELPQGTELANASKDIHVLVEIRGKSSSTLAFAGNEVEIVNTPQGYNVHVNTAEVTVAVVGRTPLINALTKEKFQLTVDVQQLEPGVHLVPLKIQYSENYDSVEIQPKEVYITIGEEP